MRRLKLIAGVASAAATLVAPSLAGTAASPTVLATVGPAGSATLKASDGRQVKTLPEGTYLIVVRDRSRIRGFHLVGTGPTQVRKGTGVRFVGTVKWRLSLMSGLYRYGSSTQSRLMRGSFRVVSGV